MILLPLSLLAFQQERHGVNLGLPSPWSSVIRMTPITTTRTKGPLTRTTKSPMTLTASPKTLRARKPVVSVRMARRNIRITPPAKNTTLRPLSSRVSLKVTPCSRIRRGICTSETEKLEKNRSWHLKICHVAFLQPAIIMCFNEAFFRAHSPSQFSLEEGNARRSE